MNSIEEKKFIHIDLFSGIGGFSYAAKTVWGKSYKTAFFCDNDLFCQAILKKRFPGVKIWGDIRELIAHAKSARTYERKYRGKSDTERKDSIVTHTRIKESGRISGKRRKEISKAWGSIDLLTGGFPCQPFSTAGKRRSKDDNRYLWPEMLECIRLFNPRWILAENVYGILSIDKGLVFKQVCLDMEEAGYEVWAFVIPAAAVNAPHRRDRVWFVAKNTNERGRRRKEGIGKSDSGRTESKEPHNNADKTDKGYRNAPDTTSSRCESNNDNWNSRATDGEPDYKNAPDTESDNEQRFNGGQGKKQFRRSDWEQNWIDIATKHCLELGEYMADEKWKTYWSADNTDEVKPKIHGVDDGFPAGMDGLELSKSRHRVERLKALGNAIVPQVAEQIMLAMKEYDNNEISKRT